MSSDYRYSFDGTNIHSRNNKNAIVMLSGGVDSTTALTWALYKYDHVKAITLNYNQQHTIEIDYATRIARLMGVEHDIINITFPKHYWGIENHLTRGQAGLTSAIAALAITHEGADIVLGILSTDNYRDCDRVHLDAIANVLFHPEDVGEIGIATPLKAFKGKEDVIAFGYEIGAPINYTWTCRAPINNSPCLQCMQCQERLMAFDRFYRETGYSEESVYRWQSIVGGIQQPVVTDDNRELFVFGQALIRSGAYRKDSKGLLYTAPDGSMRVSSVIKDPKAAGIRSKQNKMVDVMSASGFLANGRLWEVCILSDGTVASTDSLPSMEVVKNEFIRKAGAL